LARAQLLRHTPSCLAVVRCRLLTQAVSQALAKAAATGGCNGVSAALAQAQAVAQAQGLGRAAAGALSLCLCRDGAPCVCGVLFLQVRVGVPRACVHVGVLSHPCMLP
jgi:hypothetical protein